MKFVHAPGCAIRIIAIAVKLAFKLNTALLPVLVAILVSKFCCAVTLVTGEDSVV